MSRRLSLLSAMCLLTTACATQTPAATTVAAALPDPLAAGWQGASVCEVLLDNQELRVLRCSFPPGVGHELHEHAPHFGFAIAGGRARIEDARGVREATTPTGYSWWTPEVTRHANQNIGETTSVYLIVEPKMAASPK